MCVHVKGGGAKSSGNPWLEDISLCLLPNFRELTFKSCCQSRFLFVESDGEMHYDRVMA